MGEVRDESPVGHCSRDGMTVYAGRGFKDLSALLRRTVRHCRPFFFLNPPIKLFRGINVYAQEHLGMLDAAVLSALPDIPTCFMRLNPHVIDAVWNQIRLSRQTRHPKTVVRICRT